MYYPQEDSYFLVKILEDYFKKLKKERKNIKFLDMGCGSAIIAESISKFINKENILCADIEKESVLCARKKGFNSIKSNLFENIKEKFDIISFNPPYLPQTKYDKKLDISGGKRGDETIIKFLKDAKKYLKKRGHIFIIYSSLTPQKRISEIIKKYYKINRKYEEKLFMETLFCLDLTLKLKTNKTKKHKYKNFIFNKK